MAKVKFGAWIPTYAWAGGKSDPKNVKRIRESIEKCEDHGIDVWVIDHLLSAPGLYGNAWLEPLNSLAFAAALTKKVKIATGILVLPVRHPVVLAKEISTLCHLSDNRYMFGVGPGWYVREYEVTGSRIEERGRRTAPAQDAAHLGLGRLARTGSHGSRRDGDRAHRDGPHRQGGQLAVTLLGQAGMGQARLAPAAAARPGHGQGPEEAPLRALQLHPPRRHEQPRQGGGPVEGALPARHGHPPNVRAPAGVLHDRRHRRGQRANRRPAQVRTPVHRTGARQRRSQADRPHGEAGSEALQVAATPAP